MEELGRDGFDVTRIGDADCILIDESHNFRNNKSNRYLAFDEAIQRNGGRGKDGARKKVILAHGDAHQQRPLRPREPNQPVYAK